MGNRVGRIVLHIFNQICGPLMILVVICYPNDSELILEDSLKYSFF